MDFALIKAKDNEYIANTYKRNEVDIFSGNGTECNNIAGEMLIDFTSGIGVNSLGFADSGWVSAVKSQLDKLAHMSNLYYTQPQAELAEKLCQTCNMKKVFFANSGAEANEGAIKAARKYSADKYGAGRHEIITLENSFHGRTMATLSATGQDAFHKNFAPFLPGFVHAAVNDIESVKSLASDKTAAIMLECIQGEGGVVALDHNFVQDVQKLCAEKDILLIVDEVQTGIGRTGKFLCNEWYGIQPDIITLAKGLGGGLPIGAVLFNEKTQNTLGFGDHGSTFGGNPVCAAGALQVIARINKDFLANIQQKGDYLQEELSKIPAVLSLSGKGLMLGIELPQKISATEVMQLCAKKGLLVLTAKQKIRFLPPLTISEEELTNGVAIFASALAELS